MIFKDSVCLKEQINSFYLLFYYKIKNIEIILYQVIKHNNDNKE